jgi:salicylate hydroxylase
MTFPIEHGTVLNVVAFVSDRSLPADERVWNGPWVKQVSQQTMLNDFSDWAPWPRRLLEVSCYVKAETSEP